MVCSFDDTVSGSSFTSSTALCSKMAAVAIDRLGQRRGGGAGGSEPGTPRLVSKSGTRGTKWASKPTRVQGWLPSAGPDVLVGSVPLGGADTGTH
jgi:hypothetical protein